MERTAHLKFDCTIPVALASGRDLPREVIAAMIGSLVLEALGEWLASGEALRLADAFLALDPALVGPQYAEVTGDGIGE